MPRLLHYRAGPVARRLLREHGLTRRHLGALVGPASGPKWLLLAGLDRALLRSGLLDAPPSNTGISNQRRLLLAGSSAGAWRMLALASRNPETAHQGILDGYIGHVFTRRDTPHTITDAYRQMLGEVFDAADIERLADHPTYDIGIHVTRLPAWAHHNVAQAAVLLSAAAANLLSQRSQRWFYERIFLHSRPDRFAPKIEGRVLPLDRHNLLPAAVATGSVPIYLAPSRSLPGVPAGTYVDGGVGDYHLRQRYLDDADSRVVLLPHYGRRIVPGYFDQRVGRHAPADALARVLQIYPTDRVLERLPDQRLPDQDDFKIFADAPEERFRRWREVVAIGDKLGDELLEDLRSGRIGELAEPL